jgi:arylformamidase
MSEFKITIIDISLPISETMPIYPNNPPVRMTKKQGTATVQTELTLGSHTGTHVDTPEHVFYDGRGIEAYPADAFIGPCRVLDVTHREFGDAVRREDLEKNSVVAGERILVKTKNSERGFEQFYDDYVYLDGDAAEYLAELGIMLFGIDSLSVKQRGSSDNRPHTALLGRTIPILEGLDLSLAAPGDYTLVCSPLRIMGIDGAPARALLLPPSMLY